MTVAKPLGSAPVCQICREPGEAFCTDHVECNFRARRRLGVPYMICVALRARELAERKT